MAALDTSDIRGMNPEEITEKIKELRLDLAKEKGKIAVGGFPENPGQIRDIRRTIATLKTIKHEKTTAHIEEKQ